MNKVIHGDCLEVMRTMDDNAVDLVITDPPYNVGLDYAGHDDNMANSDYWRWLFDVWHEIRRISCGVAVTVGMVNFADWIINIEKPNWVGSWIKRNQCSRNRYGGFNTWEPILFYGKMGKIKQDCWLLPIKKQQGVGNHPCPKLLEMWQELVSLAPDGGIVCDPFAGSGTTAIACLNTNRKYILIEQEQQYINIINKRIAEHEIQQTII